MNPRVIPAIFLIFAGTIGLAAEPPKSGAASDDWKFAMKTNGNTIYARLHEGSSLKEFKAVGDIDAPSRAVHGVIGDIDAYPSFMLYTVECRLLKREKDSLITYQRISPKICGDRDYTLRVRQASWPGSGGLVYTNYWELANALGPPQKPGVVRVKVCEGAWLLEPDGNRAGFCRGAQTGQGTEIQRSHALTRRQPARAGGGAAGFGRGAQHQRSFSAFIWRPQKKIHSADVQDGKVPGEIGVVAFWVLRLTYLPFARLRATSGRARLVNRANIWSRHEMKLETL